MFAFGIVGYRNQSDIHGSRVFRGPATSTREENRENATMLKMLHLADLHLGWRPRDWPADKARLRRGTRDRLLERAVDFALESDVHLVVSAGDLFETYDPSPELVHHAIAQLERLEDAGVSVVTVPGNHDEITYPKSVYRMHGERWPGLLVTNPRPKRLGPVPTRGGDVHLYSLAYVGGITPARSPLTEFPAREGAGVHLAAFHGTLGGGLGERSLPLDPQALGAIGYDYVALGHIHRPATSRVGSCPAVYPGCIEGKGFDDPGVPWWTVTTFRPDGSGRHTAEVQNVPMDIQPIRTVTIDLTLIDTADELRERIREHVDAEAIQRFRLTGSLHFSDFDPQEIRAEFAPRFFYLEIRDETTAVAPEMIARWAAEPTVRGTFVQRMQARMAAATSDGEREILGRALRFGVQALQGGSR